MPTPFEQVQAAWGSADRRGELNRVVETMAAEGITRDQLDDALGKLLDEVRAAGVDDETEEIINAVGDRLHGWCHPSGHIKTRDAVSSSEDRRPAPPPAIVPPVQPSPG
jgi:hypothetical protein